MAHRNSSAHDRAPSAPMHAATENTDGGANSDINPRVIARAARAARRRAACAGDKAAAACSGPAPEDLTRRQLQAMLVRAIERADGRIGISVPDCGQVIESADLDAEPRRCIDKWFGQMSAKRGGQVLDYGSMVDVHDLETKLFSVYRSADDETVVAYVGAAYFETSDPGAIPPQEVQLFRLSGRKVAWPS